MLLRTIAGAALVAGLIASMPMRAHEESSSEEPAETVKGLVAFCQACHSLEKDGPQDTAPRLYALLGRKAGSSQGFEYSTAMKNSPIIWTEQTLDLFLKNPQSAIPGNRMPYSGMAHEMERKALIAYLKEQTSKP